MKKYLKLFTSIFIAIPFLYASLIQTAVSGNVTTNENNLPLAEANIVLTDTKGVTFGTTTDENGNPSILSFGQLPCFIKVRH